MLFTYPIDLWNASYLLRYARFFQQPLQPSKVFADDNGYMSQPKNQNRTDRVLQKPDILTCYEHPSSCQ
jgi:hypothetical protein